MLLSTSLETNIDFNLMHLTLLVLYLLIGSVWGLENPAYSSINDEHKVKSSAGVNFTGTRQLGRLI